MAWADDYEVVLVGYCDLVGSEGGDIEFFGIRSEN